MERIVDILIEVSLYSAIITIFILLFRAVFKNCISPRVQYAMWLLLVLRLMLPVTIESGLHIESILPERLVPVVQQETDFEIETPVTNEMPVVIQPSENVQEDTVLIPEHNAPVIPQDMPGDAPAAVQKTSESVRNINWRLIAFWVWAAGAITFALWLIIIRLRFYNDMQQGITSVSPKVYVMYDACCAELGVKPITLWTVDRAISPGIAFFAHPVLLLPSSMDADEEKLRYAFLHELTHKKRLDHYMTILLMVLRVIYWFNPAVHIGFAEMRSDMETACDADVIAFVGRREKRGYLTAVLELFSYATHPQLGMSQASSRRMAKRRMKGAFMRERTTFLGRAAALMLAIAMLVGCFTTACQSAPAEVESNAASDIAEAELSAANVQTASSEQTKDDPPAAYAEISEQLPDIDGDGIADTITVDKDDTSDEDFDPAMAKAVLTIALGSGHKISQEIPGWWQDANYCTADFNADGRSDIVLMLVAGGSNYDATNIYVFHIVNGKLTEYPNTIITNDFISYDQSKYSDLNSENAPWVSGGEVITKGQKPVLRLRKLLDYDPGAGITTAYYTDLSWNNSGWFIESMEIGEAYGKEQVYPGTLQPASISPFSSTGESISCYGMTMDGNGTEQTSFWIKNNKANDAFSRDGVKLLEVMRWPGYKDADPIQDAADSVQWSPDSKYHDVREYSPDLLFDHGGQVKRLTVRYESGTEGSQPYVTTIYSLLITQSGYDTVLMFRFLNARQEDGEWKVYQTGEDCENWLRTLRFKDSSEAATTPAPQLQPASVSPPASSTGTGASIAKTSEAKLGMPYVRHSYGPDSFDCAGLVYWCLYHCGVDVDKLDCKGLSAMDGQRIEDMDELELGDILFFEHGHGEERSIGHAGIYVGNGYMVHTSSSVGKVTRARLNTTYWEKNFAYALRFA